MRAEQISDRIQTQASLGVYGTDVDFELISRELKVRPSHSHRAGDPGPTSRPYPQDLWRLNSPLPRSQGLDAHLKWLEHTLVPYYNFLRTLKQRFEVRSYCGITALASSCDLCVSPEGLKLFADLGIAMNVTVIFVGDSGSEFRQDVAGESSAERRVAIASFELVGRPSQLSTVAGELSALASYASSVVESESPAGAGRSVFWALTAPEARERNLDSQLIWLASELLPYLPFLRSVIGGVSATVRCVLRTERDINDLSFSPEGVSFLTSLGIPLDLHVTLVTGE